MTRALAVLAIMLLVITVSSGSAVRAAGFNSGTLFRYPWINGEVRTRTQGQYSSGDHIADTGIQYAVDWGLVGRSTLLFAPNSGTLVCHPRDLMHAAPGFGTYISIYNSVGQVTSIIGDTVNTPGSECYPFPAETPVNILQGQFMGVGDTSGIVSTGPHIHFQVGAGNNDANPLISIPFTMSDHAPDPANRNISFIDIPACTNGTDLTKCVDDGPSDNAGTGYSSQDPVTTDPSLISTYLAQGGSSGSWWNVGAPFQSTTESLDEWGGVCRNTATAFVYICGTNVGSGLLAAQNYIDYKGVRHSVYRSSASSGVVKGQIQGALSNLYGPGAVSKMLGAPVNAEFGGVQTFDGGYIARNNGAGIRTDVYLCTPFGCGLILIARYSSLGTFCPSVNADTVVNSTDLLLVAQHQSLPYDLQYDLNGDGRINSTDLLLVARRQGAYCPVADP